MSDSENPKRKVQSKLTRKFGVSDDLDRPIKPAAQTEEPEVAKPKRKVPYGGWGGNPPPAEAMPEAAPADVPAKPESPWARREDRPVDSFGDRPPRGDRPFPDRGGRGARNQGERPAYIRKDRPDSAAKQGFNTILGSQKAALANPETAAAAMAELDPPWMKKIMSLLTDKGREKEERFLAEGVRCVTEMVQYHADIVQCVYTIEGFDGKALMDLIAEKGVRTSPMAADQLERISTTVNSQGVVAVCRSASTKPDYDLGRALTLVDGIQDPGNLGALFRTSLGFGMGMLLGKGTVNPFNPKVVRGSSGTFLRVPFEQDVDMLERIQFLRHKGYTVIATDLHAKQSLADLPLRKLRKVALLVGNEGAGADERHIRHADEVVRIPMEKTLESLNVSVAHGILCYQIAQAKTVGK